MASYDSDSSEQEFTETNVLLGYASKEAGDDRISRLGGRPEWLDSDKAPSAAVARCKVCNDMMALLLQLNGELPEQFPGHERRIYVFACRRSTCRRKAGSVRAIRAVRLSKEAQAAQKNKVKNGGEKKEEGKPKEPSGNLGDTLFGGKGLGGSAGTNPFLSGNANPFSTYSAGSNPLSTSTPKITETAPQDSTEPLLKTFAETLSLNNPQIPSGPPPPPEPWPAESSLPKSYPISYLSEAEYETLDPTPAKVPNTARMEVDDEGTSSAKAEAEAFESSMDATFQKFADRIAQNPDQCIRYEFAGAPLLYSKHDEVGRQLAGGGMPRCGNCGAKRVFEVQLMPQAIAELEAEEVGLEGMDWGTVIVGVCEQDCPERVVEAGQDGYLEEWAGVQWEELMERSSSKWS